MDRVLERNHKDEQDPAEEVSVKKQNQGEKAAAQ